MARHAFPHEALPAHAPVAERIQRAIALTPTERQSILEAFFSACPGSREGPFGLGRAVLDFQSWEIASGRIADRDGSRWWRAVNGMMVLDIACANDGAPGRTPGDAWLRYASQGTQAALWDAHQRSLHGAIDACEHLLLTEPPSERAFAAIVVDVVDRTALANRPTDSDDLAALTQRFYPGHYPICGDQLTALERMRARTADALRAPDGAMFEDVGLRSRRWR